MADLSLLILILVERVIRFLPFQDAVIEHVILGVEDAVIGGHLSRSDADSLCNHLRALLTPEPLERTVEGEVLSTPASSSQRLPD